MLKASLLYIKTQAIADLDKIPKTAKIDDLFNEFVEGEAKKLKPIRSEDDMEDSERKNLYEKMDHDILLKIEHKLRADKRAEVAREHADDSMDEQNRLLGVFELNMSLYFGIKRDGSNKGSAEFGGLKADRKAIKLEDEAKLQFDKLFEAGRSQKSSATPFAVRC